MKTPDASTKAPRRYGHVKGWGMQRMVQGRDLELHNIVVQNRAPIIVSFNTQQDGREKRTAKLSCLTNMTGLLLACFVVIITQH